MEKEEENNKLLNNEAQGTSVQHTDRNQPTQSYQYTQPYQYAPPYEQVPVPQTVIRTSMEPPPTYMAWSIFNCLFCMWPLGLIAICKSSEVDDHLNNRNMVAAQAASATARTLNTVATIWGVLNLIGTIVAVIILYVPQE
ncbi:interferon-induced transmembrane protein 1-like [Amphiura filiformis]|uniref:interferon-induced transmembrane protein 1-like n=1 Tax=Amphiura filiformis TaxID=82378 RepID=UPI003B215211